MSLLAAQSDVSGHSGTSLWSPLERVEADDRAGQQHQGIEALGVSLVSDPQPPPSTEPRAGALDRPAVAAPVQLEGGSRIGAGYRHTTPEMAGRVAAALQERIVELDGSSSKCS